MEMDDFQRNEILKKAKDFFKREIVESHIQNSLDRASYVSDYNIQPFLLKYLANFLEGNDDPVSIAKALIYPRILGTSITTIFGSKAQKMVSELFSGDGSAIPGIDLEFVDAIDGRRKYCQLKAGPNTINKDDITTIKGHFRAIKNLARTNHLNIELDDLIVGLLYGSPQQLNNHYKKIAMEYPVHIGADFWHRLTGREKFYSELIDAIGEVAIEVDSRDRLKKAIETLAKDIVLNLKIY